MILGYGTSHDAGIAVLDERTGEPQFATSLERINRVKTAAGNPLPVISWAMLATGQSYIDYLPLPIDNEQVFSSTSGFHAVEQSGGSSPVSYRWTAADAEIHLPDGWHAHGIRIQMGSERTIHRTTPADVILNTTVFRITNDRNSWDLRLPPGEVLQTVTFRSVEPFNCPPDSRTFGIMLIGFGVIIDPREVSNHAHAGDWITVWQSLTRLFKKQFVELPRLNLRGHTAKKLFSHVWWHVQALATGNSSLAQMHVRPVKLDSTYDHHLCHAASAYYPSGFDRALVFTLDGMGDWLSGRVMRGEEGHLHHIDQFYYEQMPQGLHYEIVTALLGFNPARHAGKVTGLAAFGKENPDCTRALDAFFAELWDRRGRTTRSYEYFLRTKPRVGFAALQELRKTEFGAFSREDIAYYIQKRTEREVCEWVRRYRDQYPHLKNVCLTGGVFANVRVNQEVQRLGFDSIFVQPAMSDAGLCYGAALLECAKRMGGTLKPYRLQDVYLGPGYSNEFIAHEIARHYLEAEFLTEGTIAHEIAKEITAKRVVAHFNGRMEFGPRALGNRSILYSAADPDVNRWLNDQLKRTEFMPFAPAVMVEHANEFFLDINGAEHSAEFMTITFNCTDRAQREIPAAVHVDGTARPQIVRADRNPRFHAILAEYHKLTGTPVIINTSFNMHEEPIVATPADAIRSFQQGNLDVLILGNYLVRRPA